MGQKTNPYGFRLITTQEHNSRWYSDKKNYSQLLRNDFELREFIKKNLEPLCELAEIKIIRTYSNIFVNIFIQFPQPTDIKVKAFLKSPFSVFLLDKKNSLKLIDLFRLIFFQKLAYIKRKLQINTIAPIFIKNPFENSLLTAKYVGNQIKRRVPFRRILKEVTKNTLLTNISGVKVQISGRLNGVDIARSEWRRDGQISLQTLRNKVDYTSYSIKTSFGIFGIKIWLAKN